MGVFKNAYLDSVWVVGVVGAKGTSETVPLIFSGNNYGILAMGKGSSGTLFISSHRASM